MCGVTHYDPTDLRGIERAKADQQRRRKLALDEEREDIKWLMSGSRGRRILWRIISRADVFSSSFSTNAMQMAFSEGTRCEGKALVTLIHDVCPELYATMARENAPKDHAQNEADK